MTTNNVVPGESVIRADQAQDLFLGDFSIVELEDRLEFTAAVAVGRCRCDA
jgi:hypothetical protein